MKKRLWLLVMEAVYVIRTAHPRIEINTKIGNIYGYDLLPMLDKATEERKDELSTREIVTIILVADGIQATENKKCVISVAVEKHMEEMYKE